MLFSYIIELYVHFFLIFSPLSLICGIFFCCQTKKNFFFALSYHHVGLFAKILSTDGTTPTSVRRANNLSVFLWFCTPYYGLVSHITVISRTKKRPRQQLFYSIY